MGCAMRIDLRRWSPLGGGAQEDSPTGPLRPAHLQQLVAP